MSRCDKLKLVINKLLEVILTITIVTLLSFVLMRLSPIDPAEAYARRNFVAITNDNLNTLRDKMGLNKSLIHQYLNWIKNIFKMDLGKSYVSGKDVFKEVLSCTKVTGIVVIISSVIQGIGSLIIGFILYKTKDKIYGKALNLLSIVGIAIPSFLLAGCFLDIFAVKYRWINVATNTGFMRYFPAALCLSISGISYFSQLMANSIDRNMSEDYILYMRSRGLSEKRIIIHHALPRAVFGLLPSFMQMMGLCMSGAIIVENIFSLPGLGFSIVSSVLCRDAPMIYATILSLIFSLLMFNLLSDLIRLKLNGRRQKEVQYDKNQNK